MHPTPTAPQLLTIGSRVPRVDDSAFIAPGAHIIGDVVLAPDSSVWYGAVLRGDAAAIRIGQGSNIQDGVVIHADPGFPVTVEEGVTIGHSAVVHGALVRAGALIGIGARLLNGCEIGVGALVAAGAVVTPGTVVPEGALAAGVPAVVRRRLTREEVAQQRASATAYVALAREHTAALAARAEAAPDTSHVDCPCRPGQP